MASSHPAGERGSPPPAGPARRLTRRLLGPVRVRAALGATGVVAIALLAGSLALLWAVHAGLPQAIRPAPAGAGAVVRTAEALAVAVPGLLVFVAAATWLVTGHALAPVEDIRAELAEITAGDLSRRVPEPPVRDEIGRLARTTNATLAALEAAVDRQRRFVADASHELRSPIASLRAQLEVAGAHPVALDAGGVLTDVVRLQRLAADLLLLARLDAGERPRAAPVPVAELLRDTLAERRADRVPVRLDTEELDAAAGLAVSGSRVQLGRVLTNLLDNAGRHARSGVEVRVARARDPGGEVVLVVVDDDGPGVPPADRERIFDRFIRLDDARSSDEGGAGLGLAIARDIVHRHDGTLTAAAAPGGGARFVVALPESGGAGVPGPEGGGR